MSTIDMEPLSQIDFKGLMQEADNDADRLKGLSSRMKQRLGEFINRNWDRMPYLTTIPVGLLLLALGIPRDKTVSANDVQESLKVHDEGKSSLTLASNPAYGKLDLPAFQEQVGNPPNEIPFSATAFTNASHARVRSTFSTGGDIVTTLDANVQVTIIGKTDSGELWYHIISPANGWISKTLLDTPVPTPTIGITPAPEAVTAVPPVVDATIGGNGQPEQVATAGATLTPGPDAYFGNARTAPESLRIPLRNLLSQIPPLDLSSIGDVSPLTNGGDPVDWGLNPEFKGDVTGGEHYQQFTGVYRGAYQLEISGLNPITVYVIDVPTADGKYAVRIVDAANAKSDSVAISHVSVYSGSDVSWAARNSMHVNTNLDLIKLLENPNLINQPVVVGRVVADGDNILEDALLRDTPIPVDITDTTQLNGVSTLVLPADAIQ